MDGQYQVVFDLAQSGYKAWWFPASGLIGVAIGLTMLFSPHNFETSRWPAGGVRILGVLFLAFSAAWTFNTFKGTFDHYRKLADRLARGDYQVVEGTVDNYERLRTAERFSVGGVRFEYSDARVTSAFNDTSGPIRPGLYVRISHADGAILRLEVRKVKPR
jgi:hypothetical protein